MCFSATASFVASGALLLMAGATYAVARRKDKVLVAVPLLFGIQQFFEGVQWLYLDRGSSSLLAGYGFLLFALIVWPAYVPLFVLKLENKRRWWTWGFAAIGIAVALYFAVLLLTESLQIRERYNCVNYAFRFPGQWVVISFYLTAVFGSLLTSARRVFRVFGVAIFAMSIFTWLIYERNFLSVWCFFSAAVSALFFLYVQRKRSRSPGAA